MTKPTKPIKSPKPPVMATIYPTLKSYTVEFRYRPGRIIGSRHHKGRGRNQEQCKFATVIAASPMDAGALAELYRQRHLPRFVLEEIRLDNELVIQ